MPNKSKFSQVIPLIIDRKMNSNEEEHQRRAQQEVENSLEAAGVRSRIECLFQEAFCSHRATKTVNIDYANEYFTRFQESELGMLALFMVDDLLESLNLDGTRAVFEAESGFKLKEIRDADTIKQMYRLAEDVKLFETVADKTATWYQKRAANIHQLLDMKIVTWRLWSNLNLGEYMLMYKQMFEGFPGEDSRQFYHSTSLRLLLHKCDPNRRAEVMEYTIQKKKRNPPMEDYQARSKSAEKNRSNRSTRRRSSARRSCTAVVDYIPRNPSHSPSIPKVQDPYQPPRRSSQVVIDLTRHKSCEAMNFHQTPKKEEKQKRHSKRRFTSVLRLRDVNLFF